MSTIKINFHEYTWNVSTERNSDGVIWLVHIPCGQTWYEPSGAPNYYTFQNIMGTILSHHAACSKSGGVAHTTKELEVINSPEYNSDACRYMMINMEQK